MFSIKCLFATSLLLSPLLGKLISTNHLMDPYGIQIVMKRGLAGNQLWSLMAQLARVWCCNPRFQPIQIAEGTSQSMCWQAGQWVHAILKLNTIERTKICPYATCSKIGTFGIVSRCESPYEVDHGGHYSAMQPSRPQFESGDPRILNEFYSG